MARSGSSRRTATAPASNCSGGTTPAETFGRSETSSLGQETKSFSEPTPETLCLFGDTPNIGGTNKRASSAPSFATKGRIYRRSLSDKLTQSLISAGLVAGITPSLVRQTCGLPIRAFASLQLVGGAAAEPHADFVSSNARAE